MQERSVVTKTKNASRNSGKDEKRQATVVPPFCADETSADLLVAEQMYNNRPLTRADRHGLPSRLAPTVFAGNSGGGFRPAPLPLPTLRGSL
jgi:hypothetical protein